MASKQKFVLGDGEVTRVSPGYDVFNQVHILMQTAHKDVAAARPGSVTAASLFSDMLRRLPDGSSERELLCAIAAQMQEQIEEADCGKCIDPGYLSEGLQDLIKARISSRTQLPELLTALREQLLAALPDPALPSNSGKGSMSSGGTVAGASHAGGATRTYVNPLADGASSSSGSPYSGNAAAPTTTQDGAGADCAGAAAGSGSSSIRKREFEALSGSLRAKEQYEQAMLRLEVTIREQAKRTAQDTAECTSALHEAVAALAAAEEAMNTLLHGLTQATQLSLRACPPSR
jgi:hypothetical protein